MIAISHAGKPEEDHGDTAVSPIADPKVKSTNDKAAAVIAPAMIGAHSIYEEIGETMPRASAIATVISIPQSTETEDGQDEHDNHDQPDQIDVSEAT
jgi:hypothetical protein